MEYKLTKVQLSNRKRLKMFDLETSIFKDSKAKLTRYTYEGVSILEYALIIRGRCMGGFAILDEPNNFPWKWKGKK